MWRVATIQKKRPLIGVSVVAGGIEAVNCPILVGIVASWFVSPLLVIYSLLTRIF